MNKVYVLFWFDVEDCSVMQSDDCNKHLANILSRHGAIGTFKVVGQKARRLEQHVRYDVIDALQDHDIGFHSNWHGLRPQIAEYLAPLSMEEGAAEFDRRERPGLEDVKRLFGPNIVTYGQPGSNWAPQPFSVLRHWGIPTYISGFGYVGLDCQPFWYGGILCTSHMYGKRLSGAEQRHLMGLNFELGKPGELEKHKKLFSQSLHQLMPAGGLISIINHPCTLVLEEWFSTNMKPRELTEAGYRHFDEFVEWALSFPNTESIGGARLAELYPDDAFGYAFGREELHAIASQLSEAMNWVRLGEVALSAAEACGVLARLIARYGREGSLPAAVGATYCDYPREHPGDVARELTVSWEAFVRAAEMTADRFTLQRPLLSRYVFGEKAVSPAAFVAALARETLALLQGNQPPAEVLLREVPCAFEEHVDEAASRAAWTGAMAPRNFSAPGLYELAKLGAWTVKPAILQPRA